MKNLFTGDEIIMDVVQVMPEAVEILQAHGLPCSTCHFGAVETLSEGILGHGFSEETFAIILEDLNAVAKDIGLEKKFLEELSTPKLTDLAIKKIKEIQTENNNQNLGLKIFGKINSQKKIDFTLSLQENPDKNDRILEFAKIKIFIDINTLPLVKKCQIDFSRPKNGFKIIF